MFPLPYFVFPGKNEKYSDYDRQKKSIGITINPVV